MFPSAQLIQCTVLTNRVLKKEKLKEATTGEILNCFGIIILISKFEFCKRSDLWTNTSQFLYVSVAVLWGNWDGSKKVRSFMAVDGLE